MTSSNNSVPVLTIAGSDSSGGAGIQADLKTFASLGVYGMSVITSLTAQNTCGVQGVYDVDPDFVSQQMKSVFTDIAPSAVKIGMVSNENIVLAIANSLVKFGAKNIVVDPVMGATSGGSLIVGDAIVALEENLIPLATVCTPNLLETEALSGLKITNKTELQKAAEMLAQKYGCAVLAKGGHLSDSADDVLVDPTNQKITWFEASHIDNKNTHGTGCTLSSAIATYLALGCPLVESVEKAKMYVTSLLEENFSMGHGSGPLNHLAHISKK